MPVDIRNHNEEVVTHLRDPADTSEAPGLSAGEPPGSQVAKEAKTRYSKSEGQNREEEMVKYQKRERGEVGSEERLSEGPQRNQTPAKKSSQEGNPPLEEESHVGTGALEEGAERLPGELRNYLDYGEEKGEESAEFPDFYDSEEQMSPQHTAEDLELQKIAEKFSGTRRG
nr:chromogranin B - bovine (fragments) [Bos taurus]